MNFLDSESSFLIKFPASESTADFHYVRSNSKDSLKTLLAVLFLSLMTLGACIATYSFNILALFSSGEGLSALTNYIFALMWFVGWGLAFLFSVYLLLLSLYEQEVVVINDGILEVSHGLAFFRVGFRVRVSEVAHIDMRSIQNDFSASDKYRKFLISLNNSIKSIVVSHEFNEQKFEVLQAALVRSKARLTNIDPEPIENSQTIDNIKPDVDQSKYALLVLILANLTPLIGMYFWGWQLAEIMLIYWAETLILFIYQSIVNVVISPVDGAILCLVNSVQLISFTTLHFLFIWVYFVQGKLAISTGASYDSLVTVYNYLISLWPALLALFVNHGYSVCVYLYKNHGAHKALLSIKPLLFRIVVLHITLTAGASVALLSNGHWATLIMLVSLKIVVDVRAYRKQDGLLI